MNAIVKKGEEILCEQNHICGHTNVDVQENGILSSEMLILDLFESVDLLPNGAGHICKKCNGKISVLKNGKYQIRIKRGWIGNVD